MSEANEQEQAVAPRGQGLLGRLIVLLIVLIICLIVMLGSYFRLTSVSVIGNKAVSSQEVVRASGLVEGLSMLSINEEEIARNMAQNHWLKLIRLEKAFPGTINLYVEEREPVSVIRWIGVQYTLDGEGMVMTESNDPALPENLIYTTGFIIMNIHVGLTIEPSDYRQLTAYRAILQELQAQYYLEEIKEINLKDVTSVYLVTNDQIVVRLGDYQNAQAKICAMRTYLAYLRELGQTNGLLDVSVPEDARFTPDASV